MVGHSVVWHCLPLISLLFFFFLQALSFCILNVLILICSSSQVWPPWLGLSDSMRLQNFHNWSLLAFPKSVYHSTVICAMIFLIICLDYCSSLTLVFIFPIYQRSSNCFCNRPDSTYLRLYKPSGLATIQPYCSIAIAVFQKNFTYKTRQQDSFGLQLCFSTHASFLHQTVIVCDRNKILKHPSLSIGDNVSNPYIKF